MPVDIVPIEESHIDGFHRTLDFVARERRYLAFLEGPPLVSTRAFVLDQGIGTDLIRQSLAAARGFGFHRVELTVRENNTNAIELYKKVGFETEGMQRGATQVDGVYENLILMAVLF